MSNIYNGPVRLVLFDVDGVLTDGSICVAEDGERTKTFNVRDGLAVALLRAHGIGCGVLSGKASGALDYRVQQLGFDIAITGRLDKLEAYEEIKRQQKLEDSQIVFVGDDVIDLPLASIVEVFYAPSDAHSLVLAKADFVTKSCGGRGVAREVAEHLLQSTGLNLEQIYQPLMNKWNRHDAAQ